MTPLMRRRIFSSKKQLFFILSTFQKQTSLIAHLGSVCNFVYDGLILPLSLSLPTRCTRVFKQDNRAERRENKAFFSD